MNIEHEAPHGAGGIAAIFHQVIPVAITQLGDVEAKGLQQIEGMAGRHATLGQRRAQRQGISLRVAAAEQGFFHPVEQCEFFCRHQARMIGDVIGHAREAIEGENDAAMTRADEAGGDGEILVAMALARSNSARRAHGAPAPGAWARPFHIPPRPLPCCQAESMVKSRYIMAIAGRAKPQKGESR